MLSSVIKLVIITVVFPIQATFIEPQDYVDAWEMLDEVVNSIVEQVGEEDQYVGDWVDMDPIQVK